MLKAGDIVIFNPHKARLTGALNIYTSWAKDCKVDLNLPIQVVRKSLGTNFVADLKGNSLGLYNSQATLNSEYFDFYPLGEINLDDYL